MANSGRHDQRRSVNEEPPDLFTVTDPAQAAILSDPERSKFLWPFLGRERTVSQAAQELGCTVNSLLYRVRRMCAVGLLVVVAEKPRAGRAVKIYRSSHAGYRIPMSSMRYDDIRHRVETYGKHVMEDLITAYSQALFNSTDHDRILMREGEDLVSSVDAIPPRDTKGRPTFHRDGTAWLTRDQAEQLNAILQAAADMAWADAGGGRAGAAPQDRYMFVGSILPLDGQ